MEDCWDLQAIVKGCRPNSRTSWLMEEDQDHHHHHPNLYYSNFLSEEDEFPCVYPQLFENYCSSNHQFEQEIFGKSSNIYPVLHPNNNNNNNSASISELLREFKVEPAADQKLHHKKQISPTKQKQSKKSRQNRVVKEVKAESVCSDSWGWRKYGQKPIKGSPYPRSYYRCSSSKGCSARKQVERSLSDPDIFVVTYTAEHNHAEPTRRNALAGTTRKKFPGAVPETTMLLSPNNSTNSVTSIEEEQEQPMDQEGVADHDHDQGEVFMNMNMPFQFSTEDLFTGLEDFLLFG